MVEIPDELRALYTGEVEKTDGQYQLTVPASEVAHDAITPGEMYRIALIDRVPMESEGVDKGTESGESQPAGPPVEEGEIRDVEIESIGDQGDGIAKVERGFVVIVADGELGEQLTVKIESVKETVAFADIVSHGSQIHS